MSRARTWKIISCLTAIILVAFVGSVQAETIKYVGSSTVGKFIHEAAAVYGQATFDINTKAESGGGENATAAGMTDLGGVAREVKPDILAKGVTKFLIGHDAIGVWVNSDNPVQSLTKDQLKGVFTGAISNWSEVGGADAAINVYIVNPQSATRKVFQAKILGESDYGGKVSTIRPDPNVLDELAKDQFGIGQLSFALGAGHQASSKVKMVKVGDEEPNVANSTYPITRPLYLIAKGDPNAQVQAFIDWALSDAGQAVVMKYFVGVTGG